ncbi:hypothetical protein BGZ73_003468 [Actinomortierella ambigua]|nr:hypothetical protein BGZ73_003468 [Actinomortierella ambigua]
MLRPFFCSARTTVTVHSVAKKAALFSPERHTMLALTMAPKVTAPMVLHVARNFASLRSTHKPSHSSSVASSSTPTKPTLADTKQQRQQPQQSQLQKRVNPFQGAPANSVVAYVGPYMRSLQSAKSVAFVFGACGCMAVPATLYLGNTEQLLAAVAGLVSLSPSILLHALTRHDVSKISVEGSASKTTPSAVRVTTTTSENGGDDSIQMSIEQLNWRGKPRTVSIASKDLVVDEVKSKGNKVFWKVPGSIGRREELFRIDRPMMLSNTSFAFMLDQIEAQTKRRNAQAAADNEED